MEVDEGQTPSGPQGAPSHGEADGMPGPESLSGPGLLRPEDGQPGRPGSERMDGGWGMGQRFPDPGTTYAEDQGLDPSVHPKDIGSAAAGE